MIRLPPRYHDLRASKSFKLFIFAGITTVIATRLLLGLTGYPALDNGVLHLAHVLWGGLLMMVSIAAMLAYLGRRLRILATLIGGIGFGLFIDELGKFVTHNNDYFFSRAIAIIYLIFVVMIIWSWSLRRRPQLSEQEYLLNALEIIKDGVDEGLNKPKHDQALMYLQHSNQSDPLVRYLTQAVKETIPIPQKPQRQWVESLDLTRQRIMKWHYTGLLIDAVFIIKAVTFPVILFFVISGEALFNSDMVILQLVSTVISGCFVIAGVWRMHFSRAEAYSLFSKSVIIDILLTQVFLFYRIQFDGSIMVIVNILLWLALRGLIRQEEVALEG